MENLDAAVASVEDLFTQSAAKLTDALRLETEADQADARGDALAASQARKQAQAASDDAASLEMQARDLLQPFKDKLSRVANDQEASAAIKSALEGVAPLQAKVTELFTTLAQLHLPRAPNPRYGTGGSTPQKYNAAGKDIHLGWMIDWGSRGNTPQVQKQRMNYAASTWGQEDGTVDTLMPSGGIRECGGQTLCKWDTTGTFPVYRCNEGCALPGARDAAHLKAWINETPDRFVDGMWWMIGNEIGWDDGRSPQTYARFYCRAYQMIKGVNPTFKVTPGAVLPTSLLYFSDDPQKKHTCKKDRSNCSRAANNYDGAQFFSDFLASASTTAECAPLLAHNNGRLPMDGVLIHLYPAHDARTVTSKVGVEGDLDKVSGTTISFRTLMKQRGLQALPLFIKEMGPGGNVTQAAPGPGKQDMPYVRDFATRVFPLLEELTDINLGMPSDGGKMLQRWAWFYTEWNTGVKDVTIWQYIYIYDSRTTDYYTVDNGEPLALIIKRHAEKTNPGVQMYRMQVSRDNQGGLYQSIWVSPEREGKTVKLRAKATCRGAGASLSFYVSRFPRNGGAKQNGIATAPLGVCNGRWRPIALDVTIPPNTSQLEVFAMLDGGSETANAAVHDLSAALTVTAANGKPADVEVFQNGWFLTSANMSASTGKQNPEPWGFWARASNSETSGKVEPWQALPFE